MKTSVRLFALVLGVLFLSLGVCAQGQGMRIPTRPGVQTGVFWLPVEKAKGTVLFFPGGAGGLGMTASSARPASNNYIPDTHDHLAANGYNVLMFGLPIDARFLDIAGNGRVSSDHLADIRAVLDFIRKQAPGPIWLMGFSAGTVSAAFAAINLQDSGLAGLVLTAGMYGSGSGATGLPYIRNIVPALDVSRLRIPVLLYHHEKDACGYCDPAGARDLLPRFVNAGIRKLIMANGGANPTGDPCQNRHWHGFPGMEKAAINEMAAWMDRPAP